MLKSPVIAAVFATALLGGTMYGALAADTMIKPSQVRASQIEGTTVYDRQNEKVATVKDLILDKTGKVDNVILSFDTTAGMGGKYIAVSYANLKFDNNRLTLDQTKSQLSALPSYTLEDKDTGAGEGAVPATGGHAKP